MTAASGTARPLEPRALLDVELDEGARKPAELRDARAAADAPDLLAAKGHHAERVLARPDPLDRLEARDHAERPVEPASLRHGVDIERLDLGLWPRAAQPAEEVPRAVALDLEPGLLQPRRSELVRATSFDPNGRFAPGPPPIA